MWNPVLNLELSVERFEWQKKVRTIIKRCIKAFLAGLVKSLDLKKKMLFYQEICFSFLPLPHVSFRKIQILLTTHGKTIFP